MTPEIDKMRADGWTFTYDLPTGFVQADHPDGATLSVLEVVLLGNDNLGHAIAKALNGPGKCTHCGAAGGPLCAGCYEDLYGKRP